MLSIMLLYLIYLCRLLKVDWIPSGTMSGICQYVLVKAE